MAEKKLMKAEEVSEILRNDGNDDVKMNALLGATVKILGQELQIELIKKGDGGYTLLLIPTQVGNEVIQKIGDLKNDLKKLSGGKDVDTSELEKLMPAQQENGFDDIGISLAMAFLYVDSNMDATSKTTQVSSMEYAFQIKVYLDNLLPEGLENIIQVERAEVAVWNTERPKIKNAMNLITPEEYLNE